MHVHCTKYSTLYNRHNTTMWHILYIVYCKYIHFVYTEIYCIIMKIL